jgi:hypothetical protein
MAHPNAELVMKGFEAFATGDMAAMDQLIADEAVWHAAGRGVLSGDFRGKEAIFGLFAKTAQEAEMKQDVHAILADDEHVVALVKSTATRRGKTVDMDQVFVFHVAGGKAVEVWLTPSDAYAADEFWAE